MTSAVPLASAAPHPLRNPGSGRLLRAYLFSTGVLSSTLLLKIFDIQYLEILFFLQCLGLLALLLVHRGRFRIIPINLLLTAAYGTFIVLAVVLAIAAIGNGYYIPKGTSLLKGPVWVTLSRCGELIIDVTAMLFLLQRFQQNHADLVFTAKTYYYTAVVSAIYSVVSFPLNYFGIIDLGVYFDVHRMRGFFAEGGMFGMYLVGAILLGVALWRTGLQRSRGFQISMALLVVCLFGSQAKSAFFALIVVGLIVFVSLKGVKRKVAVLALALIFTAVFLAVVDIPGALRTWTRSSSRFEAASAVHRGDGNFVAGRVAGLFIVPRMIRAHPLAGIGWGNYGLVRNAAEYRGASVWVNFYDGNGLGLFGTTAEVGIPLVLLLIFCTFIPFLYVRRVRAPLGVVTLALSQPVALIFGASLNYTWPWVISAMSMGLAWHYRGVRVSPRMRRA